MGKTSSPFSASARPCNWSIYVKSYVLVALLGNWLKGVTIVYTYVSLSSSLYYLVDKTKVRNLSYSTSLLYYTHLFLSSTSNFLQLFYKSLITKERKFQFCNIILLFWCSSGTLVCSIGEEHCVKVSHWQQPTCCFAAAKLIPCFGFMCGYRRPPNHLRMIWGAPRESIEKIA